MYFFVIHGLVFSLGSLILVPVTLVPYLYWGQTRWTLILHTTAGIISGGVVTSMTIASRIINGWTPDNEFWLSHYAMGYLSVALFLLIIIVGGVILANKFKPVIRPDLVVTLKYAKQILGYSWLALNSYLCISGWIGKYIWDWAIGISIYSTVFCIGFMALIWRRKLALAACVIERSSSIDTAR